MSMPTPDPEHAARPDPDDLEPDSRRRIGARACSPRAAAATEVSPPGESGRPEDGWSLIALVPDDGREPPANVERRGGPGRLVRRLGALAPVAPGPGAATAPDRVDRSPTSPGPSEIRVIAAGPPTGSRRATGRRPRTPAPPARSGDRPRRADRTRSRPGSASRMSADFVETEPMASTAPRLPGARDGALVAPRPDDRDGARRRLDRESLGARSRPGRTPGSRRLPGRRQPPPRGVRAADPGPRAVLSRRCLPDRPLPARPRRCPRACSPIRWPRRSP